MSVCCAFQESKRLRTPIGSEACIRTSAISSRNTPSTTTTYRAVFPEYVMPDDQWQAYMHDREGAIVGADLAKRFHWKVGDRIPIKGTIFQGAWEFNIRGIYHGKQVQDDTTQFWLHYKYLEERANAYWKGLVGWYSGQGRQSGRLGQGVQRD